MHHLRNLPSWIKRPALVLTIVLTALSNQGGCVIKRGAGEVVKGVNPSNIGAAGVGDQIEKEGAGIAHRSRERNRLLNDPDYEPDQDPYPVGDPKRTTNSPARTQASHLPRTSTAPPKTPSHTSAPPSHSHH